jgi:hypothetical protein
MRTTRFAIDLTGNRTVATDAIGELFDKVPAIISNKANVAACQKPCSTVSFSEQGSLT